MGSELIRVDIRILVKGVMVTSGQQHGRRKARFGRQRGWSANRAQAMPKVNQAICVDIRAGQQVVDGPRNFLADGDKIVARLQRRFFKLLANIPPVPENSDLIKQVTQTVDRRIKSNTRILFTTRDSDDLND